MVKLGRIFSRTSKSFTGFLPSTFLVRLCGVLPPPLELVEENEFTPGSPRFQGGTGFQRVPWDRTCESTQHRALSSGSHCWVLGGLTLEIVPPHHAPETAQQTQGGRPATCWGEPYTGRQLCWDAKGQKDFCNF